jgi:hypothetical protein
MSTVLTLRSGFIIRLLVCTRVDDRLQVSQMVLVFSKVVENKMRVSICCEIIQRTLFKPWINKFIQLFGLGPFFIDDCESWCNSWWQWLAICKSKKQF